MTHHLYLLVHAKEPWFKIGHSIDTYSRTASLGRADLNPQRSRAYEFTTTRMATHLEKLLHGMVDAYRLPPKVVCKGRKRRGGDTEWFSMECFDTVVTFLDENRKTLPWEPVDLERLFRLESIDDAATLKIKQRMWGAMTGTKQARLWAEWPMEMALVVQKAMVSIEGILAKLVDMTENRVALLPFCAGDRAGQRPLVCIADLTRKEELDRLILDLHQHGGIHTRFRGTNLFRASAKLAEARAGVVFGVAYIQWQDTLGKVGGNLDPVYSMPFDCIRKLEPGIEGWDLPLTVDGFEWAALIYNAMFEKIESVTKFYLKDYITEQTDP